MILLKIVLNAELAHQIMRNKKHKIFIIAGEVSGDMLGGEIISKMPDIEFVGIGGENMIKHGLKSIFPMSDLAVMGAIEVLAHARTLTRRINQTINAILTEQPDLVLTIDSPGFAKRVVAGVKTTDTGAKLIKNGLRFHHFVAPQVWAWRPGRAKKYAKTFDKLYAFFDFEIPYFTKFGLDTIAVGHPLADKLIGTKTKKANGEKIIALIPGSRMSEVKRLMPIFQHTVETLYARGYNNYKFVIPTVETTVNYVTDAVKNWKIRPELVSSDSRYDLYSKTYIAIAASGTVSVELAMLHIPAIIVYKMNPITTWIVKHLINVKWASLVNILSNRGIYPEFLGPRATHMNIFNALVALNKQQNRARMITGLKNADSLWRAGNNSATETIIADIRKTISK